MKKIIKVLHTEWSEGWGGQEIRIINEMIALRGKGVEVYLACREHAKIKQKAIENGIEVFTLGFKGNLDFSTMFGLKRIVEDRKIDIVNTHSGKDTWVGGFGAKLAGAKFIRTRHLSNPIDSSRFNFINEMADFIFTTGESIRNNMIEHNRIKPKKIMSIPTGIDEKIFDPKKYNKNICKEKLKIEENTIIIGIVAVLRGFKRHDNFLKIAKKIINNNQDKKFKFIIAGDGPKKASIEKQIIKLNLTPYVDMIGHIEDVAEFLKTIDIFMLTSDKNEGVPQSLIQALMMEIPSIATTAGSIKDLHKDNNFLISESSVEEIYTNLHKLINKELSLVQNRAFIVKNFGQKSITNKIIKIYEKLICTN